MRKCNNNNSRIEVRLIHYILFSSDVKRQLTKLNRQSTGENKLGTNRLRRRKAKRKNIISAKLRLLQQKTGLALLDVWNVIEAFRENGLNHVEPDLSIPRAKLEALLASMYGALAKRLPPPTGKQYAFKR